MKNSRRSFILDSILGTLGVIVATFTTRSAVTNIPIMPYCLSNTLLQKCGDSNRKISEEAWGQIIRELNPYFISEIIRRTQLPFHVNVPSGNSQLVRDFGYSTERKGQEVCKKNHKIILKDIEDVISSIVEKINKDKTATSYISDIGVYEDIVSYEWNHFGFYGWTEIQNCKPRS